MNRKGRYSPVRVKLSSLVTRLDVKLGTVEKTLDLNVVRGLVDMEDGSQG